MTEIEQLRAEIAKLNERLAVLERAESREEDRARRALEDLKRAWAEKQPKEPALPYPYWRGPYFVPLGTRIDCWPPGTILC